MQAIKNELEKIRLNLTSRGCEDEDSRLPDAK
jgi:hypothetical protein